MQCQMVDLWSSIDCCKLPRLSWFFLYLALSVAFLPDSQFAVSALHTELLQTAQPITLLSSTFFSFEDLEYLEPLYTEFLFEWMLLQLLLLLEGCHNDRCSSCTISANCLPLKGTNLIVKIIKPVIVSCSYFIIQQYIVLFMRVHQHLDKIIELSKLFFHGHQVFCGEE